MDYVYSGLLVEIDWLSIKFLDVLGLFLVLLGIVELVKFY